MNGEGTTAIGRCIGCDRVRVLDNGVCEICSRPPRGRWWAEMSSRVRRDPSFAPAVFRRISTRRGRALFVRTYGLPSGAVWEDVDG
mgnify:CR=1 FL=1